MSSQSKKKKKESYTKNIKPPPWSAMTQQNHHSFQGKLIRRQEILEKVLVLVNDDLQVTTRNC